MLSGAGTVLVALGGLEEIGLNALVVEAADDLLLLDCGLLFPDSAHPGCEYLIPDFRYLLERRDKFRGILLTHGHEDHIGAVGHLLEEMRVEEMRAPVYGTRFTTALLYDRLAQKGLPGRDLLRTVNPGAEIALGRLRAEYARVSHSIPDACAVLLRTAGGTIVHGGDFTMDTDPVAGRRTDRETLRRWGERGVDLLCCDSTNALESGATASERRVAQGFSAIFPGVEGRLYVAQFASNVGRMQQVVEASRRCGRRVAPLGRAVTRCSRIARQHGYLQTAPGDWIAEPRSHGLPRSGLTVLCGGSQAEPGSALWRVARGLEPHHLLRPGDAVVLSARIIPGNELAVQRVIDRCVGAGARVFLGARDGVHVSGHPAAADVAEMLELVRPRQVLPVHGDLWRREALLRLAAERGYEEQQLLWPRNGQTVVLEQGRARLGDALPVQRICIQGERRLDARDEIFPARRRMAKAGAAVVFLRVPTQGDPEVRVVLSGVCSRADRPALQHAAEASLRAGLSPWAERHLAGMVVDEGVCAALRRAAGKELERFLRREGLDRSWVEVEVSLLAGDAAGPQSGRRRVTCG